MKHTESVAKRFNQRFNHAAQLAAAIAIEEDLSILENLQNVPTSILIEDLMSYALDEEVKIQNPEILSVFRKAKAVLFANTEVKKDGGQQILNMGFPSYTVDGPHCEA